MSEIAVRTTMLYAFQLGLGALWLVASFAKLRAPRPTEETIRRVLFSSASRWNERGPAVLCRLVLALEAVLGVMLLSGWQAKSAAVVSTVLLLAFIGVLVTDAVVRARLASGGDVSGACGCFGSIRARPPIREASTSLPFLAGQPGLSAAVVRNLILAIVSLGVAAGVHDEHHPGGHSASGPIDAPEAVLEKL